MTDKELLEYAANAHGNVQWVDNSIETGYWDHDYYDWWNPLTDDGDALRLAVKLHLDVQHNSPLDNDYYVVVSRCGIEMCRDPVTIGEDFEGECERSQSTRRAIVRVAAEIGKAMV